MLYCSLLALYNISYFIKELDHSHIGKFQINEDFRETFIGSPNFETRICLLYFKELMSLCF